MALNRSTDRDVRNIKSTRAFKYDELIDEKSDSVHLCLGLPLSQNWHLYLDIQLIVLGIWQFQDVPRFYTIQNRISQILSLFLSQKEYFIVFSFQKLQYRFSPVQSLILNNWFEMCKTFHSFQSANWNQMNPLEPVLTHFKSIKGFNA